MKHNRAYKKFCIVTILIVAGVLAFNLIVWNLFTQPLLSRTDGIVTGDLARLSYLNAHTEPRRNSNDLPSKHLNLADYTGQQIDIVTVGDSFSQGGGGGLNAFYQDHIASLQGLTVLNCPKVTAAGSYLESIAMLVNSGLLDQLKPRFVILQRVERKIFEMGKTVDLEKTLSAEQLEQFALGRSARSDNDQKTLITDLPTVGFMNTGNFKWLWYRLCYLFSTNAFTSKVHHEKLDRPMFSGRNGNSLLYMDKDLHKYTKKRKALDERAVRKINHNLNRLASLLAEKNIQLVFMPAPDKYTLYRPYLLNKRHSRSSFYEHLRWQPKAYQFIDTEAILARELKNGVKDLYWIDDGHWSWKASQAIFEQFRFE